ncbi:hypothetical protein APA_2436 [Pseudanabaena sp. lw0831]|nr:hypothetical protein APA_2436 [Pseudanabaena sp. lw0831]
MVLLEKFSEFSFKLLVNKIRLLGFEILLDSDRKPYCNHH